MVEVDLEFPVEMHDKFRQSPPCPENLKPKEEWMSDDQTDVKKKLKAKFTTEKLTPRLTKHDNYVLHYRQ